MLMKETKKTKKTTKQKEAPREHKKSWQELTATVDEIKEFLDNRVFLRNNVITRRTEVHVLSQFADETDKGPYWTNISDRILNTLWTELAITKPCTRVEHIQRVIESSYVPDFNPFTAYLDSLPKWKGDVDYIMELSLTVNVKGDADEQILFYQYLKKWMIAMLAGWQFDHVVNHTILVLLGPQGCGKSSWLSLLLPPQLQEYVYTKANAAKMSRDDMLILAQKGLVIIEEMDALTPREQAVLKAITTMNNIDERAAYARYHEHRPHVASMAGTGNVKFLNDPTGSRRWIPFFVENIDNPRKHPFNYTGIYSQAYALLKQGFQYWFSQEEIERLTAHNVDYEVECPERELVDIYFRKPHAGESGEFMPVSRAMQTVSGGISQKLSMTSMSHAFRELGFEYRRTKTSRGYIVVQRSALEIKERQTYLAGDTDDG